MEEDAERTAAVERKLDEDTPPLDAAKEAGCVG